MELDVYVEIADFLLSERAVKGEPLEGLRWVRCPSRSTRQSVAPDAQLFASTTLRA